MRRPYVNFSSSVKDLPSRLSGYCSVVLDEISPAIDNLLKLTGVYIVDLMLLLDFERGLYLSFSSGLLFCGLWNKDQGNSLIVTASEPSMF